MNHYPAKTKELFLHDLNSSGVLDNAEFACSDLSESFVEKARFKNNLFENCVLKNAIFRECRFDRVSYIMSDLRNFDCGGSFLSNVSFRCCDLIKASMNGGTLHSCSFEGCSAMSINFEKARIINTVFQCTDIYRINLHRAVVINSVFINDKNRCYSGTHKGIFTDAVIIGSTFKNYGDPAESLAGSVMINCTFEETD
jgi:uncharacterized protein YjbI with pentapeptide repeats